MDEADNSGYTSDSSEEEIDNFVSQDIMPGLSGYQNEPQYDSSKIDSDNSSGVESKQLSHVVWEDLHMYSTIYNQMH